MKRAKRALAFLLAFILLTSVLAGCGRKEEPADKTEDITGDITDTGDEKTETPEPEETPPATPEATETPDVDIPVSTPEAVGELDADDVFGTVEGSTYTNEFFGFSMAIPEGWYIASREEFAQLMETTEEFLESDFEDARAILESQEIIPLLFAAVNDPFTYQGTNPNINIMAQNISKYASLIKDARSFLNIQIQGMKAQGMDMTFEDVEVINIDGKEVARVNGVQTFAGIDINQTLCVFLHDGFAVLFALSSFSEEEARQLEDVISGVTFR
jgi:predicted small lipoprotein YifL